MGILLLGQSPTPFTLALTFNPSVSGAPQSFVDAMNAAAAILMATILDPITVRISVGYGEFNSGQLTVPPTAAEGADMYGSFQNYSDIRSALISKATSSVNASFNAALPNTGSIQAHSTLYVPAAAQKALGFISPTAAPLDGTIGVGVSVPTANLVGVALHEMTHAMGREPGDTAPFCLGRFTAAGTRLLSIGSGTTSYFSYDGGTTNASNYGTSSDTSDFLNSGNTGTEADTNDPFNEFYSGSTLQVLTTAGKHQLDCLGFNISY